MTHTATSTQQSTGVERRPLLLASHPFCRLINAHCDQPIIYNCGEQNKNRLPMLPTIVCPHAQAALLLHAIKLRLNDTATISGSGDTAKLFVPGKQLASITRGTMTSTKQVLN